MDPVKPSGNGAHVRRVAVIDGLNGRCEMDLLYFDESGDDGLKPGASRFLALTSVRISADAWVHWHDTMHELRRGLEASAGIPAQLELHTRDILRRKACFTELALSDSDILNMIEAVARTVKGTDISIHNIVVDKRPGCSPLGVALLSHLSELPEQYVAISDRGRVPKMKQLIRDASAKGRLAVVAPEYMLEMESSECPMIQLADFFATAAYLRACSDASLPPHARISPKTIQAITRITEGANRTYRLVAPNVTA